MRLHGDYCSICDKSTMFIEKLKDCKDPNCNTIVDICIECDTPFKPKIKNNKIKIKY